MPWDPSDAAGFDKGASTPKKKRQWAHIANSVLRRTGSESRAIRAASSTVGPRKKKGLHRLG